MGGGGLDIKLPNMKRPCGNCPFKKDTLRGWLGAERMKEILTSTTFVCHKDHAKQCAGHMLIKGDGNAFVALANQLSICTGIGGRDLVFDTEEDCINHHEEM